MLEPQVNHYSNLLTCKAKSLIGATFTKQVNCFCVAKNFFVEGDWKSLSADEMLNFTHLAFQQVYMPQFPCLKLIWSRTNNILPPGGIEIDELVKRKDGFPFGLILEHSFVQLDQKFVYQKPDPLLTSSIEVISIDEAITPYQGKMGFEITRHIFQSDRQT